MEPHLAELETCPICLDTLSGQPLGVCLGADGCRKCLHYFHLGCLQKVEGARCPQCRVRFCKRTAFPSVQEDSASWCTLASLNGQGDLSRQEVSTALSATLMLPPSEVDALVNSSWRDWTQGCSLDSASVHKMVTTIEAHMPHSQATFSAIRTRSAMLSLARPFFGYDAFGKEQVSTQIKSAEKDASKEEDGHSRSGVVCSCGQIHVRRGDRVRRGPAPANDDEEGIITGFLGTIVRVGERQESVMIKWDRSPSDEAQSYIWPDPEGHVVAPALFSELSEDVIEVQKLSGLSSSAAEELLRRVGFDLVQARVLAQGRDETCEEHFRQAPQLFHQVRILPDSLLVQQWFDGLAPCPCSEQRCRGGLQWSSRADKHLGREGAVLKIDEKDDTVLVETIGPCECKIWYPRLAVTPVYNPDLSDKLLFEVNTRVQCRMDNGWLAGVVNEVLWDGPNRKGSCPYTVTLDDERSIFVPNARLIRAHP